MKSKEDTVKEMQLVCEQMIKDDIEENPDIVNDFFECQCCGKKNQCMAGSIEYGDYRLCNDCVLMAEVGFELKKFKNIQDLIDAMEDNRLEAVCDFIKEDQTNKNN